MRNRFYLLLVFSISFGGFAQSGYYGSRFALEAKMDIAPSVTRVAKYDSLVSKIYDKRRWARTNYGFNVAFTATRRVELSLGAEYSNVKAVGNDPVWQPAAGGTDVNILGDPVFHFLSGKFEFKYYKKGSLAPIGKYFGLSVQYGRSWFSNPLINYGYIWDESITSFFKNERDVVPFGTDSIYKTQRTNSLSLQLKMGRTTAITKRISLVSGLSIPLTTIFFSRYLPIPVFPSQFVGNDFLFNWGSEFLVGKGINDEWVEMMALGIKRQMGFSVELGFRFHL